MIEVSISSVVSEGRGVMGMSMQRRLRAHLVGWTGPLFPEPVVELAKVWSGAPRRFTYCGPAVYDYARHATNLCSYSRLQSSDCYWWMWGLEFRTYHNGRILILLPWDRDDTFGDGVRLDCSPAVYIRGIASFNEASAAAGRLARALGARSS